MPILPMESDLISGLEKLSFEFEVEVKDQEQVTEMVEIQPLTSPRDKNIAQFQAQDGETFE